MISLRSITVDNWVTYKNASLTLEAPLTVIRGLNLDVAHDAGANRTGKSLIPSAIPRVLFDTVPQPVKGPRKAKQAFRTGTSLTLDIVKDKNHYRLQKYFERSAQFKILEGKNNRGIRLKKDAELALRELFPLNEDQFYSTVYIDARKPSLLQYGMDAQRFHFFEQVFDLGIYKSLNEALKQDVQELSRIVQECDVVEEEIKNLGPKPDLKEDLKALSALRTRLLEKKKVLDQAQSQYKRLTIYVEALSKIPDGPLDDLTVLEKRMDDLSTRIDKAIKVEEQNRIYKETEETRQQLMGQLKPLRGITVDPKIAEEIVQLKADLADLESEKEAFQERELSLGEALLHRDAIKVNDKAKATSVEVLKNALFSVQSNLRFIDRLTNVLDGSLDDHEATCPICVSKFKPRAFIERMEKEQAEAFKKKRLIEAALSWHEKNNIVLALQEGLGVAPIDDGSLQKRLDIKTNLWKKMHQKATLVRQIKALPVLEFTEKTENLSVLRAKNLEYLKRHSATQRVLQAKHILKSLHLNLPKEEAERRLKNLTLQLPRQQLLFEELENKIQILQASITHHRYTMQRINDLTKKKQTLETHLKEKEIIDALRVAFGPRGLVKEKTQDLARVFEESLNEYAPFIFDEPMTFRLDVTETKFSIFASRNHIEDDVRSFSGQESRAFSLITMLSLLRFMPVHLRCDFIVMDEIESNLDAPSMDLLANKFIPELQRFVKNILIITPKSRSEFYIPDAVEFYAVKHKGESQLIPFDKLEETRRTLGGQS